MTCTVQLVLGHDRKITSLHIENLLLATYRANIYAPFSIETKYQAMKVKNFLSNGVPDEALLPPPQLSLGAVHVPREVPLGINKVPDKSLVKTSNERISNFDSFEYFQ